jgi:ParB family transcriptional regulator, chromosome partitioning protein
VVVRQSGLGKGLGALLPSGDLGATVSGGSATPSGIRLADIPISEIRPNTYQPRTVFDDDGIASLAASIAELGVLQPILVRPAAGGGFELIAGERRWRAARRAGLTSVPAIVKAIDDHGSLEEALVENLHRSDLNPLEEASAYQQLIDDFKLTHEQVATRVGKSRAAVSNTLRLFQLSPSIQRMVLDGIINAGHARALLGTTDKSFQESLARRITGEELSVRAVEEAVRLRNAGTTSSPATAKAKGEEPAAAPSTERPAGLLELEDVLAEVLGTRVGIAMAPNRPGKMTIDFADLSDLERIFRIMTSAVVPADEPAIDS